MFKEIFKRKIVIAALLLLTALSTVNAQETYLHYFTQINASGAFGDYTPYWFAANRQGLVGLSKENGYIRYGMNVGGTFKNPSFRYNAVADFAIGHNQNAEVYIQQLCAEISWRALTLSVGCKERFAEGKIDNNMFIGKKVSNNVVNTLFPNLHYNYLTSLGTGGLMYSGNCRPIPQVRLEIPDFTPFPGTNKWLHIKAHIAYGAFSDAEYQKRFTQKMPSARYGENILYHSKSGFIKIGRRDKFPLEFEGGLEMYSQFGGEMYRHADNGRPYTTMPHSFMDYIKAFIPLSGGKDTPLDEQSNISGNQIGSWHAAFNIYTKPLDIRLYGEHLFEDFSQLFFFEYQKNKDGVKRTLVYPWRDILLGISIKNKSNILPFISTLQYEYMSTYDQSGALYHDPSNNFHDQMDGMDNYYNHGLYPGWHHWGMGIGNPLVFSPAYNSSGNLQFRGNRVIAHHVGVTGSFEKVPFAYRLLYTYSENWGTYHNPFDNKCYTTSLLGELTFAPDKSPWLCSLSLGYDKSNFIGENLGAMLTITHVGTFFSSKK